MAHSYEVGTRVWQPDPTEGWVASEVESKNVQGDKVKLVFQLANGEVSSLCEQASAYVKLMHELPDKKHRHDAGFPTR